MTPERAWWDLKHYDLSIEVDPATKSIRGSNEIRFEATAPGRLMQIDLQQPLRIMKAELGEKELTFSRNKNVYLIDFGKEIPKGTTESLKLFYQGKPTESKNPPWSGGFSWDTDSEGKPFIATTCQGIGASIWWPCKDHGADEPDEGININITVPEELTAVSNGRLASTDHDKQKGLKTFHWVVTQPINNYCVSVNIGNYVSFSDEWEGEFGELDLQYWVLEHQREKAIAHFKEVPRTIEAFEHWFGKYPFYEDSYKLVVVPYPGMEHQSAVTYGNGFRNGYRGKDLSGTGVGMKFDFIIVHESGHEWFGNSISAEDIADLWVQEGFTNYAENLFVEFHFSKQQAEDYVIGCRKLIKNDRPIIGVYGVNHRGSGDMYYKGGNMLHMMRHIVNDDQKWRSILLGLNKTFWHQTVTSKQIEDYVSRESDFDFSKVFDQYLRTTDIPQLKYEIKDKTLSYHLEDAVEGFEIPARGTINGKPVELKLSKEPQTLEFDSEIESFELDRNFLIEVESSD